MPIHYCTHWPSCLSAIWSVFATFKPFGLFSRLVCSVWQHRKWSKTYGTTLSICGVPVVDMTRYDYDYVWGQGCACGLMPAVFSRHSNHIHLNNFFLTATTLPLLLTTPPACLPHDLIFTKDTDLLLKHNCNHCNRMFYYYVPKFSKVEKNVGQCCRHCLIYPNSTMEMNLDPGSHHHHQNYHHLNTEGCHYESACTFF